jgi:glycosyltransferase involved in cell wall biosynthesis
MKFFLYLKHFPSSHESLTEGTSKAVHGLATGFVANGLETVILCEGTDTDISYNSPDGYHVKSFQSNSTKPSFKISPSLKCYISSLSTAEQNLFILNGIFHPSVYSLSRFLRKHSLPYIFAPHDPYHPTIFQKNPHLKWPYWFFLERTLLKQASGIQVLDKRHAEWIYRLGIKTPVIEVTNGFSPNDVLPEATLSWSSESVPNFLFLGRLDAHNKGLDILLNAFAQLTNLEDWKLTLQGPDWGDRFTLKAQAKDLNLSSKVTFLEPDYSISPSSIIAKYDVFCVTSRFEGFSLSALEAMLAGRVLLVSEIAGIAPHVEASGCGVVVRPEASAIKAGLIELLQKRSQWQEMGLRGRQYVLNNLHWNSIAVKALEDYKKVL